MIDRKLVSLFNSFSILTFCLFVFVETAHSQELHEFYNGSRAMAMGGAQIAVVNDETALLSNPAGLGKLRDYYGTILDPEADFGQNLNGIYTASPFTSPFDPAQVATSLNSSRNTYYHARAQVFPSFVVKNFGIGVYYRYLLDMRMNSTGTSLSTFYWEDAALLLGYNFRFFDGRVKLGFTGKLISRIEIDKQIALPASVTLQNQASEGAAVGGDIGLNLAGPWHWIPTLSVVARDVGSTQFTAGKNVRMTTTGIPNKITQDYDIAFAVFPIHANRTRSSFTIEVQKYLAAVQSTDQLRYLHVGWELNQSDFFFLRAGMNGRWWTAGLELATEKIQFQLTTYGEDIGQGTTSEEDRRYIFKFAFRF